MGKKWAAYKEAITYTQGAEKDKGEEKNREARRPFNSVEQHVREKHKKVGREISSLRRG